MTAQQHRLMNLLRDHAGRAVSYGLISESLWPPQKRPKDPRMVIRQAVMDVRMHDKAAREAIRAVLGYGYVWIGEPL